jgi:hypothetical protein
MSFASFGRVEPSFDAAPSFGAAAVSRGQNNSLAFEQPQGAGVLLDTQD